MAAPANEHSQASVKSIGQMRVTRCTSAYLIGLDSGDNQLLLLLRQGGTDGYLEKFLNTRKAEKRPGHGPNSRLRVISPLDFSPLPAILRLMAAHLNERPTPGSRLLSPESSRQLIERAAKALSVPQSRKTAPQPACAGRNPHQERNSSRRSINRCERTATDGQVPRTKSGLIDR